MNTYRVTLPEMAIVAATRGMAGLGAGLLISSLVAPNTRRTLGWTLFALGAASTVPILMALTAKRNAPSGSARIVDDNAEADALPSNGSAPKAADKEIYDGDIREKSPE